MAGRPYVLKETPWLTIQKTEYEIAVLPWGATEAHNLHLPYGTDTLETEHIAVEAAALAWSKGAAVCVLPTIPIGVNTGQKDIPFTLSINPSTQLTIIADLIDCLARQNLKKLLILNGHGGNDFRPIIRELQDRTSVFLCTLNWYDILSLSEYFVDPGDHAGEMETSLMLSLVPDFVLPLSEAGRGNAKRFKTAGLRERWVWAPREWKKVTSDTGVGDPHRATIEKGARFFKEVTEKISSFLVEFASLDLGDLYE